ncbi:MAG: methyltransferase domain-containing protein [Fuerstiella sp.]
MQPLSENQFTTGYVDQEIKLADRTFHLRVPDDPDLVLEQAARDGGHDPYWSVLWSAARPTAEVVLQTDWTGRQTVLELGCGMGLTGLAALMCGLHVTFTDAVPTAVRLALHNAQRNGFSHCDGHVLDWNTATRASEDVDQFDVILASDVLYERKLHLVLLKLLRQRLTDDGICLIGDPFRQAGDRFIATAQAAGWVVSQTERPDRTFRCIQLQQD